MSANKMREFGERSGMSCLQQELISVRRGLADADRLHSNHSQRVGEGMRGLRKSLIYGGSDGRQANSFLSF